MKDYFSFIINNSIVDIQEAISLWTSLGITSKDDLESLIVSFEKHLKSCIEGQPNHSNPYRQKRISEFMEGLCPSIVELQNLYHKIGIRRDRCFTKRFRFSIKEIYSRIDRELSQRYFLRLSDQLNSGFYILDSNRAPLKEFNQVSDCISNLNDDFKSFYDEGRGTSVAIKEDALVKSLWGEIYAFFKTDNLKIVCDLFHEKELLTLPHESVYIKNTLNAFRETSEFLFDNSTVAVDSLEEYFGQFENDLVALKNMSQHGIPSNLVPFKFLKNRISNNLEVASKALSSISEITGLKQPKDTCPILDDAIKSIKYDIRETRDCLEVDSSQLNDEVSNNRYIGNSEIQELESRINSLESEDEERNSLEEEISSISENMNDFANEIDAKIIRISEVAQSKIEELEEYIEYAERLRRMCEMTRKDGLNARESIYNNFSDNLYECPLTNQLVYLKEIEMPKFKFENCNFSIRRDLDQYLKEAFLNFSAIIDWSEAIENLGVEDIMEHNSILYLDDYVMDLYKRTIAV